jgi:hypothetical protein
MTVHTPLNSSFEAISVAGPTLGFGSILDNEEGVQAGAWMSRVGADWTRIPSQSGRHDLGEIRDFVPATDGPGGIAVGGAGAVRELPGIWTIAAAGG